MPQTVTSLQHTLNRIDGKGYPAYKEIKGCYTFEDFTLFVDHVQGDPFAAPSRLRVQVPMTIAKFPPETYGNTSRWIALCDYLARQFAKACHQSSKPGRGSGKSGLIAMDMPGQEILERSSIIVTPDYVEARFVAGLPAQGRRILGRQAIAMLCQDVPHIIEKSLCFTKLNSQAIKTHICTAEDADTLRAMLPELGLVAFVANNSILPRHSGIDDRPLSRDKVTAFNSPDSLQVTVTLPHAGQVKGLGVPTGVTLIVGGGYHGKSTLLSALERGVYNHIPGDGRELVVANPTSVKIRAEDGRNIEGVDIRPFISNLPNQVDASAFRTKNASGSTSQAANIIEALEINSEVLLLDEDTCATNLMIRDARMQALVEKSGEPITPFVDRVRQLYERRGVSTILVLGGSGDYFEVAHHIIRMHHYLPQEVTEQAKNIARRNPTGRQIEVMRSWQDPIKPRFPVAESLNPRKGKREISIKARALRAVSFGTEEIDMNYVAQLVDEGQLRAIGQALNLARKQFMKPEKSVTDVVEAVMTAIDQQGLDILDSWQTGDYVKFRSYEFVAALNRLRTLKVVGRK